MTKNEEQNFAELYENSLKKLEEGTVVKGTIVDIVEDEIFVDLGYKADGVIPREEFSYGTEKPSDKYKVGDEIEAYILRMNNGKGNVLLSTKRLQTKQLRSEFEQNVKDEKPVEVKVTDVVNGGVIAEHAGIKVFIPQTQLAKKTADLNEYRGKVINIKVIEYNPEKRKIVGSERKLFSEAREKASKEVWDTIEIGKVIQGTVKQLNDYGAFVDIGGIDGLLHVSEISWKSIKKPSEILKVGDSIEVHVISFDKENSKISLGHKKAEDNPWINIKYQVGDVVEAKITSIKPFGAFAELENGLEGLIHISNITNKRIARPQEVFEIGQVVTAKVLEINADKKRIELSTRELEEISLEEEDEQLKIKETEQM